MIRLNQYHHREDIFRKGEYVKYFCPDDDKNPFKKLYAQKRSDILKIISNHKSKKCILDVGGGYGRISLPLAESKWHTVVLTDISREMLLKGKEGIHNFSNLKLLEADVHQLPLKKESFDFIISIDLMCHLKDPLMALEELYQILKRSGTLIIDSTNSNPIWSFFFPRYLGKNPVNWLRIIRNRGVLPGWVDRVKHYRKTEFIKLLKIAGFEIKKIFNYGPPICPKWHLAIAAKGSC